MHGARSYRETQKFPPAPQGGGLLPQYTDAPPGPPPRPSPRDEGEDPSNRAWEAEFHVFPEFEAPWRGLASVGVSGDAVTLPFSRLEQVSLMPSL